MSGVGLGAERLLGWPPSAMPQLVCFGTAFTALAMLAKASAGPMWLGLGGAGACRRDWVHEPAQCASYARLDMRRHPAPLPPWQVDVLSATTSPANKGLALIWGLVGFAAALAVHVLQPGCAPNAAPRPACESRPASQLAGQAAMQHNRGRRSTAPDRASSPLNPPQRRQGTGVGCAARGAGGGPRGHPGHPVSGQQGAAGRHCTHPRNRHVRWGALQGRAAPGGAGDVPAWREGAPAAPPCLHAAAVFVANSPALTDACPPRCPPPRSRHAAAAAGAGGVGHCCACLCAGAALRASLLAAGGRAAGSAVLRCLAALGWAARRLSVPGWLTTRATLPPLPLGSPTWLAAPQNSAPEWAAEYIAPRRLATAGLTLHLLLPLLSSLLWVRGGAPTPGAMQLLRAAAAPEEFERSLLDRLPAPLLGHSQHSARPACWTAEYHCRCGPSAKSCWGWATRSWRRRRRARCWPRRRPWRPTCARCCSATSTAA